MPAKMRILPAKQVEFYGLVPRELIGAKCWPTVKRVGVGPNFWKTFIILELCLAESPEMR